MSAPRITVAVIAAPCAPKACDGVENGQAMRQPALIARPAPAPYSAPATIGRVTSDFRNNELKSRTRSPPATVLPIPHVRSTIQGEVRRISPIRGGRGNVADVGLQEKVSNVTDT